MSDEFGIRNVFAPNMDAPYGVTENRPIQGMKRLDLSTDDNSPGKLLGPLIHQSLYKAD